MGFRHMFTATTTPVAVDLGGASAKLLQVSSDDVPEVVASYDLSYPEDARVDIARRLEFLADTLPDTLKREGFSGRRVVCSPSSSLFTIQQVDVQPSGPVPISDQVRGELGHRLGRPASSIIARSFEMPSTGSGRHERLCLAISRDDVMRHVEFFKSCRLDVVAVHADHTAILNAFTHVNRRANDQSFVTMYVDVGWGAVKVVLGQGSSMVLGRIVQVGGRHIDLAVAEAWGLSVEEARTRRWQEEPSCEPVPSLQPTVAAVVANGVGEPAERRSEAPVVPSLGRAVGDVKSIEAVREIHETIADELSMCARFAVAAVPGNTIHRLVLLGGESRSASLAGHLARAVGVPTSVGDPLKQYQSWGPLGREDGPSSQPEWAVACGLCSMPLEL